MKMFVLAVTLRSISTRRMTMKHLVALALVVVAPLGCARALNLNLRRSESYLQAMEQRAADVKGSNVEEHDAETVAERTLRLLPEVLPHGDTLRALYGVNKDLTNGSREALNARLPDPDNIKLVPAAKLRDLVDVKIVRDEFERRIRDGSIEELIDLREADVDGSVAVKEGDTEEQAYDRIRLPYSDRAQQKLIQWSILEDVARSKLVDMSYCKARALYVRRFDWQDLVENTVAWQGLDVDFDWQDLDYGYKSGPMVEGVATVYTQKYRNSLSPVIDLIHDPWTSISGLSNEVVQLDDSDMDDFDSKSDPKFEGSIGMAFLRERFTYERRFFENVSFGRTEEQLRRHLFDLLRVPAERELVRCESSLDPDKIKMVPIMKRRIGELHRIVERAMSLCNVTVDIHGSDDLRGVAGFQDGILTTDTQSNIMASLTGNVSRAVMKFRFRKD